MGHHFVPQRYLRGFQAPTKADWIWMYDKTNDTSKFVPINKVAQSAGFYDEEVEQMLNLQVEIPGNNVIDKIRRNEAIDERDRLCLTGIRRVPCQSQSPNAPPSPEQFLPACRRGRRNKGMDTQQQAGKDTSTTRPWPPASLAVTSGRRRAAVADASA